MKHASSRHANDYLEVRGEGVLHLLLCHCTVFKQLLGLSEHLDDHGICSPFAKVAILVVDKSLYNPL